MAINIWGTLLKSESITEIFVPTDLEIDVSLEDFYNTLKKHLEDKGVQNYTLSMEDVKWDEGKHNQRRIVARYTGTDAPKNIQQILIGLDNVGSFRYVEEKTFLARPELPKFPMSRPSPQYAPGLPMWGAGIAVVSLLLLVNGVGAGFFGLLVGGGLIAWYLKQRNDYQEYESEVSRHESETRAWDSAWRNWENNVLETSYMQATTNAFGRFQRSVSSCVRYAITELFEDKKAELKDTRAKEFTEQQIEEQMKKKRDSFK